MDWKQQLTSLGGMRKIHVSLGKRSEEMRFLTSLIIVLALFVPSSYGEMYKWVDEKGTVHFTDDLSTIPEKNREGAETRKPPKETPTSKPKEKPKPSLAPTEKPAEPKGFEVKIERSHETWETEVLLNGRVKRKFMVDTGASSASWTGVRQKSWRLPLMRIHRSSRVRLSVVQS